MPPRPSFDQLPLRPNDPPFSSWGLWGEEDQVGTLLESRYAQDARLQERGL
ncbi:hypothetical protein SI65_10253 [Aspergillus cristatus]|uniref:Uncharacterized protein n=1 Tax=Aspergillus cristatus TaxID=573508 RepID=A0A1E3B085_ASPCR|nr:hypothetical protein SI65_10253 [Aspergillus cristatus]